MFDVHPADSGAWLAPPETHTPTPPPAHGFWSLALIDTDLDGLATAVIGRLAPRAERLVPCLDDASRDRIHDRLRHAAVERLRRQPVEDEVFLRACGHPTLLTEMTFEAADHPRMAAALHAVNHDSLADDLPVAARLTLRARTARCLARTGDDMATLEGAVAMMEDVLERLDPLDDAPLLRRLRVAALAWLARRYQALGLELEAAFATAAAEDLAKR